MSIAVKSGQGPESAMTGTASAVTSPPPKNGSNTNCLYPKASNAGLSASGSVIRMRMSPVAVTPIDCPKSPMPRSNQYRPIRRGARSRKTATLNTMPATDRMTKDPRFSPMASSESVPIAAMMRKSRAQPWIRNIIWWSMRWAAPTPFATAWRITPPRSADRSIVAHDLVRRP